MPEVTDYPSVRIQAERIAMKTDLSVIEAFIMLLREKGVDRSTIGRNIGMANVEIRETEREITLKKDEIERRIEELKATKDALKL